MSVRKKYRTLQRKKGRKEKVEHTRKGPWSGVPLSLAALESVFSGWWAGPCCFHPRPQGPLASVCFQARCAPSGKDKEKTRPLPGKHASGYGGSRDFVLNTSGISGLQQEQNFRQSQGHFHLLHKKETVYFSLGHFYPQTAESVSASCSLHLERCSSSREGLEAQKWRAEERVCLYLSLWRASQCEGRSTE